MTTEIYLGEKSDKIYQRLKKSFSEGDYSIERFATVQELVERIKFSTPELLIISRDFGMDSGFDDMWFQAFPVILYGEFEELEDKAAFYNKGIKRVVDLRRESFEELIAVTRMLLYRIRDLRNFRQKSLTFGTLHGFSLGKILQNVLVEKKNFVIQVLKKDWKGKIRSFQGHIVSAFTPHLQGVDAALKSLFVTDGAFLIRRYQKMEEYSPNPNSTFAVLAEAKFERQEVTQFLSQFGISNPIFTEVPKAPENLTTEEETLLKCIKEYRAFQDVFLRAPFPPLKTIRLLQNMLSRNVIQLAGEVEEEAIFSPKDVEYIQENLLPHNQNEIRVLILGTPKSGKTQLIRTIARSKNAPVNMVRGLEISKLDMDNKFKLVLVGVPIDDTIQPILNKLRSQIHAIIFLIDASSLENFDYLNYLLHQVLQTYMVPFVVGVTHAGKNAGEASLQIREKFRIPGVIEVIPINPDSFGHIRQLIYNLKKLPEYIS